MCRQIDSWNQPESSIKPDTASWLIDRWWDHSTGCRHWWVWLSWSGGYDPARSSDCQSSLRRRRPMTSRTRMWWRHRAVAAGAEVARRGCSRWRAVDALCRRSWCKLSRRRWPLVRSRRPLVLRRCRACQRRWRRTAAAASVAHDERVYSTDHTHPPSRLALYGRTHTAYPGHHVCSGITR